MVVSSGPGVLHSEETQPGWVEPSVTGKQFCDASLCSLGQTAHPDASAQSCAAESSCCGQGVGTANREGQLVPLSDQH